MTETTKRDEREAFEEWAEGWWFADGGDDNVMSACWNAWQARDTLAAAPEQEGEPVAWRELCRRLYVELLHCDQQMRSTRDEEGETHWTQSAVVRDVLADAKTALDTVPTPASTNRLTDEKIIQIADHTFAKFSDAAIGDEWFVSFAHSILSAAQEKGF